MTSANLALIGAFVALPFLGFLCFRFSHKARNSLAVAKIASVAGVGFFALWLIATVGLSVALFSQITAGPRL
jgi:hypothetical protein